MLYFAVYIGILIVSGYVLFDINCSRYSYYIRSLSKTDIQKSRRIKILSFIILIMIQLLLLLSSAYWLYQCINYNGVIIDYGEEIDDKCYSLELLVNVTESVSQDNYLNGIDFNTVVYVPNNCKHYRSIDEIKERYPIGQIFEDVSYDQESKHISNNENEYFNKWCMICISGLSIIFLGSRIFEIIGEYNVFRRDNRVITI